MCFSAHIVASAEAHRLRPPARVTHISDPGRGRGAEPGLPSGVLGSRAWVFPRMPWSGPRHEAASRGLLHSASSLFSWESRLPLQGRGRAEVKGYSGERTVLTFPHLPIQSSARPAQPQPSWRLHRPQQKAGLLPAASGPRRLPGVRSGKARPFFSGTRPGCSHKRTVVPLLPPLPFLAWLLPRGPEWQTPDRAPALVGRELVGATTPGFCAFSVRGPGTRLGSPSLPCPSPHSGPRKQVRPLFPYRRGVCR